MKTLILLRHAKSDWKADFGADHERPLNRRGERAARQVGRFLAAAGETPDAVVTSSAVRARTTVELASAAGGWECPVRVTDGLYGVSASDALRVVRDAPEEAGSLLLAGHQPTWSELAAKLIGGGRVRVPTAALARVDFAVERWRDVDFGRGELIWLLPPKLLERAGWEAES